VKNRRILVRELAARAEEFIPYYNGKRRKDGLNVCDTLSLGKIIVRKSPLLS